MWESYDVSKDKYTNISVINNKLPKFKIKYFKNKYILKKISSKNSIKYTLKKDKIDKKGVRRLEWKKTTGKRSTLTWVFSHELQRTMLRTMFPHNRQKQPNRKTQQEQTVVETAVEITDLNEFQKTILMAHNDKRAFKSSTDALTWDSSLASSAQTRANYLAEENLLILEYDTDLISSPIKLHLVHQSLVLSGVRAPISHRMTK